MKGLIYIGKNNFDKKLGIGSSIRQKHQYNARSLALLSGFSLCFLALLIRIGYIQFVKGTDFRSRAYNQQTTSQVLVSKRGTIYDSTNMILAISSSVDSVSINKGQVLYTDGSKVPNETLASGFAEIFSLDYEETLEKLNEDTSVIAKFCLNACPDNTNADFSDY